MQAIVAACLLWSSTAMAATYYVSPSGNDSNAGTEAAPWKTLQKVAGYPLNAGDVVYLRAGVYPGYITLSRSGAAGNPITLAAYPGEQPIVEGSGRTTNTANAWNPDERLIYISGSYVTVKGLELRNSAGFGIRVTGGNYAVIDSVHAHNNYFAGVYFLWSSYGTVVNSVVHDSYDYGSGGTGGGGDSDCMGSSAGNTWPPPTVYGHHTFRNNVVYNCSDDGIDTWTSQYNTIEGNVSHHAGYSNASNGGSNSIGQPIGNGNGFKLGKGGYNTVRNNVAYNNLNAGFDDNSGPNSLIYNNTAYNNQVNFSIYTPGMTLMNNISFSGNVSTSGNPVQSNNNWNLGLTATNAWFVSVDPASPNFLRLAAGSPAIDRGTTAGLSGITYSGAAPDLGAFEYNTSTTNLPPAAPRGLKAQ